MVAIKTRIRIVLLFGKFESPRGVFKFLKSENSGTGIKTPTEQYIGSVYKKFCQTGSVLDKEKTGRPKKINENEKSQILDMLNQVVAKILNQV